MTSSCCSGLAALLQYRSEQPAPDEEQGIPGTQAFHRGAQAAPRGSALKHSADAALSGGAAGYGIASQTGSAHPGRPSMGLQVSPKLRGSLPTPQEQQPAAGLERFALPSVVSLPPERHLQPSPAAHSLPMAPRTFTSRRELRPPQPEQAFPSLAPFEAPQRNSPHSFSRETSSLPEQQQQGCSGLGRGIPSEAEDTGSLPEGMARHDRSGSGQEQGLAMAEQVINAYRLGLEASETSQEGATIPGTCTLCVHPLTKAPLADSICPQLVARREAGHLFRPLQCLSPVRVCFLANIRPSLWETLGRRCL